jgi:hypothetical protein
MNSSQVKNPKKILLLVNLLLIGLLLLLTEILLHRYFPYYTSLKPVIPSENYYKYGWGNFPREKIYFLSLDDGSIFSERVNKKGWRDKDRHYKKPKDTYRILLLGDSELYGALVKKEERYAFLLEKMLQVKYKVEVISLSNYGWGTDQILEAIQLEGLKYQPDLIITQFNHNDIHDNIYYQIIQEKINENTSLLGYKPFYYDLDSSHQLIQHTNPYFKLYQNESLKQKLKSTILKRSEILKRVYGAWLTFQNRIYKERGNIYYNPRNILVEVNENRIEHFKMVFNLEENDLLIQTLRKMDATPLQKSDFTPILQKFKNYSDDSLQIAETIFEDLFFQDFWSPEIYRPEIPDTTNLSWQVFYQLMDSIHSITQKNQIQLAILPCIEEGSLDFFQHRYWVAADSASKVNALLHNKMAKNYAKRNQIEFIEPTRPLERAKNDLHMNAAGNKTMAEEIYQYLIREKSAELAPYKK